MPDSGSGTFTRNNGVNSGDTTWELDAAAGVKITTDRHDAHDTDIATALTNRICKDGQTTPTANLPMGGFLHSNVAVATARTHYARASQVQDSTLVWGGTSTGAANTFVITLSPAITAYAAGLRVAFLTHQACTSSTTLNINSVGAVAMKVIAADTTSGTIASGQIVEVIHDGTYFQIQNVSSVVGSIATDKLLGRDTAGTGVVEQIGVSGGIAFSGSAGIVLDTTGAYRTTNIASFWSSAIATGSGSGVFALAGSSTSGILMVVPKALSVTHLSVCLSTAVSSGTYTFLLTKNGVSTAQTVVLTSADTNGTTGNAQDYAAITAQAFAAGDMIQVTWSAASGVLSSSPCQGSVTVWGHFTA